MYEYSTLGGVCLNLRRNVIPILTAWLILLVFVFAFLIWASVKTRPIIISAAKANVKNSFVHAVDKAVINVIDKENITYDTISRITKDDSNEIKDIEIDVNAVNKIKSLLSNEIYSSTKGSDFSAVSVPLGTLFLNDYLSGYGPNLKFKVKVATSFLTDFESKFCEAGINQTLHQIIIKITMHTDILLLGKNDGFDYTTTAILAQTVIVGEVPNSFTNVSEYPNKTTADKIFNYSNVK